MTDTLSPASGFDAFNTLKDRIAATPPLRIRAITLAEAARRGIEVAAFLSAGEVAAVLPALEGAGLPARLADDLRLASHALFHRSSMREHTPAPASGGPRVPVDLWESVLLVRRDLLDTLTFGLRANARVQEVLARVRSGTGYVDHAQDLATLAELAREHSAALQAGMPGHFQPEVVDRAAALAAQMLDALGIRADDPVEDVDQRLWSLFVSLYNDARAALTFVWRKEPNRIEQIPSLAGKRAGGTRAPSSNATAAPTDPASPTE